MDDTDSLKRKRKRLAWAEDGELAILDLWAERVGDLGGLRKIGHIYTEMASELAKLGHTYSARDVQVKISNFTQRYRKEKTGMGPSGGSPSTWPFYQRVHQIIGGFKANNFTELALESIDEVSFGSQPPQLSPLLTPLPSPLPTLQITPLPSSSPPLASPSSPPSTSASAMEPKKKKEMGHFQTKILQKFDELSSEITQHLKNSDQNEKELINIEKEKAASFQTISKANEELKNAIISFFKKD